MTPPAAPTADDASGLAAFAGLVRLAHGVLYPLEGFAPPPALDRFDGATVARLAQGPFRRPVNRAAAGALGLPALVLDAAALRALADGEAGSLALRLLVEPPGAIEAAALAVAAVGHSGPILGVALKRDRDRLRTVFGDVRFQIATREAPLLWTRLRALGLAGDVGPILAPEVAPATARTVAVAAGLDLLGRFVLSVDVVAADLFARRAGRPRPGMAMAQPAAVQLVRLLAAGGPSWSVPIV